MSALAPALEAFFRLTSRLRASRTRGRSDPGAAAAPRASRTRSPATGPAPRAPFIRFWTTWNTTGQHCAPNARSPLFLAPCPRTRRSSPLAIPQESPPPVLSPPYRRPLPEPWPAPDPTLMWPSTPAFGCPTDRAAHPTSNSRFPARPHAVHALRKQTAAVLLWMNERGAPLFPPAPPAPPSPTRPLLPVPPPHIRPLSPLPSLHKRDTT